MITDRGTRLTVLFVSALSISSATSMAFEAGPVRKGRVELSTAASFVNFRERGGGDSYSVLSVPLRAGWMVADPVELEAETLLTVFTGGDGDTGATGSAHLLYHFGGKKVVPFLLLGGGYGNAVEIFGAAIKGDANVALVGAGAGIRAFVGDRASFRAEYRYTRYFSEGDPTFSRDTDLTTHRVLVGFSVWFR